MNVRFDPDRFTMEISLTDDDDAADPGGAICRVLGEVANRIHGAKSIDDFRFTKSKDRALGYQCDTCADRAEMGGY